MGLLTPCFVPGEGFLYTIIVPGGGFLLPSSRVPGVCPGGGWFWMKLIPALYMPSDSLYGSKYKYIPAGIDVASRYKVARPLRTKRARDVAEMIADIYKVGPVMYPKIFQCDNGSEFKGDVTKMLEKNEVKVR